MGDHGNSALMLLDDRLDDEQSQSGSPLSPLLVMKGSKIRFSNSEGMPGPLSLTSKAISRPFRVSAEISIRQGAPSWASRALAIRLLKTWAKALTAGENLYSRRNV